MPILNNGFRAVDDPGPARGGHRLARRCRDPRLLRALDAGVAAAPDCDDRDAG